MDTGLKRTLLTKKFSSVEYMQALKLYFSRAVNALEICLDDWHQHYQQARNKMRRARIITISAILSLTSCSSDIINNNTHKNIEFSNIKSDYHPADLNNYGCSKIDSSAIMHILQTGTLISKREVHDHHSTTGCSISGNVFVNGIKTNFTFEYGGIMYFDNGTILGCNEICCSDEFSYCSYDAQDLKGVN